MSVTYSETTSSLAVTQFKHVKSTQQAQFNMSPKDLEGADRSSKGQQSMLPLPAKFSPLSKAAPRCFLSNILCYSWFALGTRVLAEDVSKQLKSTTLGCIFLLMENLRDTGFNVC